MRAYEKDHEIIKTVRDRLSVELPDYDANTLRRSALTLHRWYELECGIESPRNPQTTFAIERDENGKPYRRVMGPGFNGEWRDVSFPTPDLEKGALARAREVCDKHGLKLYIQGDPRGWPVYVGPSDMDDANYPSKGVGIRPW